MWVGTENVLFFCKITIKQKKGYVISNSWLQTSVSLQQNIQNSSQISQS